MSPLRMFSDLPASSSFTQSSFEANGINISYLHTSLPLPKLVFLHGLFAAGPVVLPVISLLSDHFQIFLPDARGHGLSQPIPPSSFHMDNLVADAAAFIRHISPNQPVFLSGHSMGASTAARVAKEHPDLVRALTLEDPPWLRLEGAIPTDHDRTRGREGRGEREGGGRGGGRGGKGPETLFAKSRDLKAMSDEEFEEMDKNEAANLPPFAYTFTFSIRLMAVDIIEPTFKMTDDVINEAVNGIICPTLLMTASPDGHCKKDVAEITIETWKAGRIVNFENCGHLIHIPPRSEKYTQIIRDFFGAVLDG